ncbi:MAG: DUF2953 domain-containing protein [Alicyclobacillus herbarius]|uniref:DUF2953 domain-containing protein n=1 Tax=Alicyclobacillus herbarius TaxID=122960 RepID=UPI002357755B|nr:DUF2953 domain-containing protein [Alicyclobacillus herbarius]MCL6631267.1 DUF2953 domain-containing protein [Alicyclobacillus herbarius]
MWILWLLLVLILLFAFCLALPVSLHISIEPTNTSRVSLDIMLQTLFGLVRIRKKIHSVRAVFGPHGPAVAAHHQTSGLSGTEPMQTTDLTMHEALEFIRHWPQWVDYVRDMFSVLKRVFWRIRITELRLCIDYGTKDAGFTGILYGFVWSGLGLVLAWFERTFSMRTRPAVRVNPNFHEPMLTVEGSCIMRLRLGYAILAIMGLVRVWRRRANDGTPDSRAHADSHEQHP